VEPIQFADYVAVGLSLLFLAVASYYDLKTREVSDKLWLVYGPIGLAFTAFRLYLNPSLLLFAGVSIGFSVLVAFGLAFTGLWGGADTKALICLALTLPLPPTIVTPVLGYVHPFFPIVVLVIGYVCSISVAFWVLAKNLVLWLKLRPHMFEGLEHERVWRKALALIAGYPTPTAQLKSTFYLYPMEKVVEDEKGARRELQIYSDVDVDRDEVVAKFNESLQKVGSPSRVWATPGLPMLLFLLVGVVVALIFGDPIMVGIFLLLGR
jgi:preflagellin peptidase FlaK